MGMTREFRVYAGLFAVVAGSVVLTGCIGGPTYGTDKTAGEHLIDDLGSSVSLGSAKPNNVKYQPRPGLVLPPSGETAQLVQPQQNMATKDNPQWIESPEDTRQRLRAEADAIGFLQHGPDAQGQGGDGRFAAQLAQAAEQAAAGTQPLVRFGVNFGQIGE